MTFLYTMASVVLVSLVSLIGIFTLSLNQRQLGKIMIYLVSFAAGGLFGDAFIHILPETFETLGFSLAVSVCVISGILIFFTLEKFLRWQHCHVPTSEQHIHPLATLNLVGDAFHNLLDGMIIAASYQASIPIGIATTLAVMFHEIPQEIGDFGILVHAGLDVRKALLLNFATALTACVGALIVLVIGPGLKQLTLYLLPVTAGGFLYIACSDLIPELQNHDAKISVSLYQLICIIAGVGVMALLVLFD